MNIIGHFDRNDKAITAGSIIDIHQTVNGCNLFVVMSDTDVRYYPDNRPYEYNIYQLFVMMSTHQTEIEIVGNYQDILDDKINKIIG